MSKLALLFDLDGTLIESDHLHHAAFATILAERGEAARHGEIADRKEAMFRDSLATSVEPLPGVGALLDWAEAEGVGIAVVTNAPRRNAEAMLAAAGLATRVPTLVIGEECARPKPDPLPYQTAMRLLGATPSTSTAFEDSRSGLRAARGSGAYVFGLSTGLTAAQLTEAGARTVIADFTAPALWAHLQAMKARVA